MSQSRKLVWATFIVSMAYIVAGEWHLALWAGAIGGVIARIIKVGEVREDEPSE